MTAQLVEKVGDLDTKNKVEFFERSLGELTVGDCLALVQHLEEKWDVDASGDTNWVIPPGSSKFIEDEIEQTEFEVKLREIGPKKIAVIKALRTLTGQSLKDAKGTVDKTPVVVQEKLSKEEAEKAKATLEEAGATVELR